MVNLDSHRDAVIVVDVQNDFCPGGALAVPDGDQVIPPLNALLRRANCFIVATRDWHPENHCSFKDRIRLNTLHLRHTHTLIKRDIHRERNTQ